MCPDDIDTPNCLRHTKQRPCSLGMLQTYMCLGGSIPHSHVFPAHLSVAAHQQTCSSQCMFVWCRYVLKSQMKELLELEAKNAISIEDEIEMERKKVDAKTPITEEVCNL